MFVKSMCVESMENENKNNSAQIWAVFETREHFDS